jgi:hypothetical protein
MRSAGLKKASGYGIFIFMVNGKGNLQVGKPGKITDYEGVTY